jgi:hypothetical protein
MHTQTTSRSPRLRAILTATLAATTIMAATLLTPTAHATTPCPNEQLRQASDVNPATGQPYSMGLAECRAYELVSTNTENLNVLADPDEQIDEVAVGADGNEVVWKVNSDALYADPPTGVLNMVVANRGADGWLQSDQLTPPGYAPGSEAFYLADTTPDLSDIALAGRSTNPAVIYHEALGPLDYVERDAAGSYTTIATDVSSNNNEPDQNLTLSPDGTHAFLTTLAQLAGDTHTSGRQLYEWTPSGGLRVFAVDDAGHPLSACGAVLGGIAESGLSELTDHGSNPVSQDGSRVFFTSPDPAGGCGPGELYVRENDSTTVEISKAPSGAAECEPGLTECEATFLSATSGGSKVYFTTKTYLTPDKVSSAPALYEYEVATRALTLLSTPPPSLEAHPPESFITPDGSDLVFNSKAKLTSYENAGRSEIYRSDAPSATVSCVSCNPTGAPPDSPFVPSMGLSEDIRGPLEDARAVSEDGSTIFFVSAEDLVPAASNHQPDVYEWHNGTISLLSSGTSAYPDFLLGMSASGSDVFFMTRDQLVPQDNDEGYDIYDARIGGGVTAPSAPAPCASAEACRSVVATPPTTITPASVNVSGPGNVATVTGSESPPRAIVQAKTDSRAEKLKTALKACRRDKATTKRKSCEKVAQRHYGPATKKKRKK